MSSGPFDIRSSFFKDFFEKALPYSDYVKTGTPQQLERWNANFNNLQLNQDQKSLISSFKRKLSLLVLSGIWCGDCMRQGPMLAVIAANCANIDLRFIDNQEYPELRDELRIAGGTRVPVAVALSEDFFEISRFGDRTLSHYRGKLLRETGAACDAGLMNTDRSELNQELSEWLDFVERAELILQLSPFLRSRYKD